MEKQFLHYSNLINRTTFILIVILGCLGCGGDKTKTTDYKIVKKYFWERHNLRLNKDIKQVVVLSENGCVPCNTRFAEFILYGIKKSSSIILVTASGARIDLSKLDEENKNILYDQNITDTPYTLFNESKIIFINNNSIDTIITIDARQIEKQFELIKMRQ